MLKILLTFLIVFSATYEAEARKKRVLNLENQRISDLSVINVPNRIRKLLLAENLIESLDGLILPEKLRRLDLDFNLLTTLEGFEANPFLERLEIGGNKTIVDYSGLEELGQIKYLALDFNNLDENNFDFNLITSSLEVLTLAGNHFTNLDLTRFSKLQSLNIKGFFTPREGFDAFLLDYADVTLPASLKKISVCSLEYEDDFTGLVLPENLEELDLANCFMTQDEIKTLNIPPNVKKINLRLNSLDSVEDIEFPDSLRVLNLRRNSFSKEEKRKTRKRFGKKVKVRF